MKSLIALTLLFGQSILASGSYDLICSGRQCTHDPYGGACTNIFVGVKKEEGTLVFRNINNSNHGKSLFLNVTDISKNLSRGVIRVEAENDAEKANFTLRIFGAEGVRGEFKSSTQKKIQFQCNRNAVVNL